MFKCESKKFFSYIAIALIFGLFGCDASTSSSSIKISLSDKISAPRIISYGSYLTWNSVNYATDYDIYKNDVLVDTTSSTSYEFKELDKDEEFFVIAKDTKNNRFSKPSNTVIASKNTHFFDSEILDLSGKSSFYGTISASIRKVVVHKQVSTKLDFFAYIDPRNSDLTFELANVTLTGQIATQDKQYSRLTDDYNVIINVTGNCSINGQNGISQTDIWEDNSEMDGIDGGNGLDAIIAPTVVVKGNGSLTVRGGDGGNGGKGASTTQWSDKTIGKGSNGGNGGSGILTQYLVVDMDNDNSKVEVYGGSGGSKGNPGDNVSSITGPLVSMMYETVYNIGKPGASGKSVVGVVIVNKGKVMR